MACMKISVGILALLLVTFVLSSDAKNPADASELIRKKQYLSPRSSVDGSAPDESGNPRHVGVSSRPETPDPSSDYSSSPSPSPSPSPSSY
ncbi:hypothetical protein WN943_018511 [Citrus x changshan-huyou]